MKNEKDLVKMNDRDTQENERSRHSEERITHMRRIIAANMQNSLLHSAQLTHHSSFDATAVLEFRARCKAYPQDSWQHGVTINDILLFATARTLTKFKYMNAHCNGETISGFEHVNLGVAVDTPRGLMVPTLFMAESKRLKEISCESKALASAAKTGKISPELLSGATFTVTNLGSMRIESFTPILNPPQVGILGVCCVSERVKTVDGVQITYPAMGLSLTYDHRAVDGAPASQILRSLAEMLEGFDANMDDC